MEQFTLISKIVIESDLKADVCVRPSSPLINDLIATFKIYQNEQLALNDLDNFITEQTPVLFAELQSNFPNIASNYYL